MTPQEPIPPLPPDESVPPMIPFVEAAPPPPAKLPHPGFWWSVLWFVAMAILITVAVTGVAIIVLVVTLIIRPQDLEGLTRDPQGPEAFLRKSRVYSVLAASAFTMQHVVMIGGSLLLIRIFMGKEWPRKLAIVRIAPGHVVLAILLVPAMGILSDCMMEVAKALRFPSFEDIKETMKVTAGWPVGLAILLIAVGPAIGEELFFRGFLGRGLVGRFGPIAGILITSLFFAVIHIDPPHAFAVLPMGIVLHYVYWTTRCFWLPVLIHFLNNGLATLLTREEVVGSLNGVEEQSTTWDVIVAAAVLLAAVCWGFYRSRARVTVISQDADGSWPPWYPNVEEPPPGQGEVRAAPLGLVGWLLIVAVACGFAAILFWPGSPFRWST